MILTNLDGTGQGGKMNKFLHCIDCGEGSMETFFDQYLEHEYDPSRPSEPVKIIKRDDLQEFLKTHQGHQLEYLKLVENSFVSEKDFVEPVKTSYFKATNNRGQKFVIKRFREKIDERLKYQVVRGDYVLELDEIDIQAREITNQLELEFVTHPLTSNQISRFLKLYKRIVRGVDAKKLERISEESPNPLEVYYQMDDMSFYYLLRNCRNIFKGKQFSDIGDFIYSHVGDVLLLKARYRIQIIEKARGKREAVSKIPAEVKKAMKKK